MAYDVHLEIFEGPLDLLLYLIRKNDLEIAEIPIAQITAEYLGYLEVMKELNLEVAGDFLVMASTLMQIKARMLLPSQENEEEEGPNPLEELKTKLLEYQKFKEVAQTLSQKEHEYSQVYYRPPPVFEKSDYVLEASLFELIASFRGVLKELPKDVKEIVYKEIPIEQKIREILDMFEEKQYLSFRDILQRETSRHGVVVSFLAILELVRLKQILACQSGLFDEIRIYRVKEGMEQDTVEIGQTAVVPDGVKAAGMETVAPGIPENGADASAPVTVVLTEGTPGEEIAGNGSGESDETVAGRDNPEEFKENTVEEIATHIAGAGEDVPAEPEQEGKNNNGNI